MTDAAANANSVGRHVQNFAISKREEHVEAERGKQRGASRRGGEYGAYVCVYV